MKVEQQIWTQENGWRQKEEKHIKNANLVIYFGGKGLLDSGKRYEEIKSLYPHAHLLGCSTGGEIYDNDVLDNSVVLAAIEFDNTPLKTISVEIKDNKESFDKGKEIAKALKKEGLSNVFILSNGTNVNGSELVRGLYSVFDKDVIVTGGLAGDAADFGQTFVGLDATPKMNTIAAVGFYGDALKIGYGSVGGWDVFGPKRVITKSQNNILYELDGKPALDLYKRYLGEEAEGLPGSALLFPLSVSPEEGSEHDIVRTVVGIDEENKAMIFAGDVPEGYSAQLMHGDFDHLVNGAAKAAKLAEREKLSSNSLAILVSCIGRKLLLGQEISDETEAVSAALNNEVPMIGFYSYGEICHQQFTKECGLHNQTMTVTILHEQ